jgi:hypothetical protein
MLKTGIGGLLVCMDKSHVAMQWGINVALCWVHHMRHNFGEDLLNE